MGFFCRKNSYIINVMVQKLDFYLKKLIFYLETTKSYFFYDREIVHILKIFFNGG